VVFLTTGCLAVVLGEVVVVVDATFGFGVVVAGLLLSTFHPASTFF
jgi:hypothetical protein